MLDLRGEIVFDMHVVGKSCFCVEAFRISPP